MNGRADRRARGFTPQVGEAELATDRKLVFVRDCLQWERDRKRILGQLTRYGFRAGDRMCVSVALDEAIGITLHRTHRTAIVAYSVSPRTFHVRIRLLPDDGRPRPRLESGSDDKNRWLLASACMSRVRLAEEGNEIDMWRNNTMAPPRYSKSQSRRKNYRE